MLLVNSVRRVSWASVGFAVATTICVATAYFLICYYTPSLSMPYFGKTIRLANMLRCLCLVSPFAVIGTGIGAFTYNVAIGFGGTGGWPIMPVLATAAGLVSYGVSKTVGRSTANDLVILTIYGVFTGLMTASNLAVFSLFASNTFNYSLIAYRIMTNVFVIWLGYLLLRGLETAYKKH